MLKANSTIVFVNPMALTELKYNDVLIILWFIGISKMHQFSRAGGQVTIHYIALGVHKNQNDASTHSSRT